MSAEQALEAINRAIQQLTDPSVTRAEVQEHAQAQFIGGDDARIAGARPMADAELPAELQQQLVQRLFLRNVVRARGVMTWPQIEALFTANGAKAREEKLAVLVMELERRGMATATYKGRGHQAVLKSRAALKAAPAMVPSRAEPKAPGAVVPDPETVAEVPAGKMTMDEQVEFARTGKRPAAKAARKTMDEEIAALPKNQMTAAATPDQLAELEAMLAKAKPGSMDHQILTQRLTSLKPS